VNTPPPNGGVAQRFRTLRQQNVILERGKPQATPQEYLEQPKPAKQVSPSRAAFFAPIIQAIGFVVVLALGNACIIQPLWHKAVSNSDSMPVTALGAVLTFIAARYLAGGVKYVAEQFLLPANLASRPPKLALIAFGASAFVYVWLIAMCVRALWSLASAHDPTLSFIAAAVGFIGIPLIAGKLYHFTDQATYHFLNMQSTR
jgi:hypothetical protein